MKNAPLFSDIADGPDDGQAWWLTADDGVRIRVAAWAREAPRGTVLLFPGRTEYIEKYGRTARDLAENGYATLAIDWRGQGLAERLVDDAMAGHVLHFSDYQRDVAAMVEAAETLDLPKTLVSDCPFHGWLHRPAVRDRRNAGQGLRLFGTDVGHPDGRGPAPAGLVDLVERPATGHRPCLRARHHLRQLCAGGTV